MLDFINDFNRVICIAFLVCYLYQILFIPVSIFLKPRELKAKKLHKYAVVIPARNESAVIGELIASVKKQNYPAELLDIFVIADNCTDNTAQVARDAGAVVYERQNKKQVGKGYALDYIFKILMKSHASAGYEAFFVFDADNLLDENYVMEMNKMFDSGYRVVTSYRNSKNYGSNWISAGYSLWFLREAKYLNNARMVLGTSCAISGTGFLIHKDIVEKNNGWKQYLLTEDIEFNVACVLEGETIGYCGKAKFYDEQPTGFKEAWTQRLRWAKGAYQVFTRYGIDLAKNTVKTKSFSCFDMLMTVSPAIIITLTCLLVNSAFCLIGLFSININPAIIATTLEALKGIFIGFYQMMFGIGIVTLITEWKEIHCSTFKKLLYTFTFPLFMLTYMPIAVVALFKKIEWKPIKHTVSKSLEDVRQTLN